MRAWVARLRRASELVLAGLLVVCAGRFAFVAAAPLLARAMQVTSTPEDGLLSGADKSSGAGHSELEELKRTLESLQGDPLARSRTGPSGPQPPPQPAPAKASAPGEFVRVVLSVTYGSERSQVFLDGELVGHTAFFGDVSCRKGSDVTIRIVPARGEAIERVRRCDGELISISN